MAEAAVKEEGKMDMQAAMEVYKKLAIPSAPHKLLAKMAGSWITKSKGWMDPSEPPMESEGTCEQKMILGDRYLYQEFSGDMMGTPFKGIGMVGYDNHTKKYVSTWMDDMSTGIYYFEGTASKDGKTITQTCDYDDPVQGPMTWRAVSRYVDDDHMEFEMYGIDESGNENKMMEMTYTRK